MRMGRSTAALLAACLSMAPLSGCVRGNAPGDIVPANGITVDVENQNFYDMDVYVVADGLATRLGTVTGNRDESFVLDPSVVAQDLRLVATPIGGNGRASSGVLVVAPGQSITFKIAPQLRNSTTFIR